MSAETQEWPKPSLTADVLAFTLVSGELAVLLIRRGRDPFAGMWALPGGFCEPGETVAVAATRELEEETRLAGLAVEELRTMSTPGRDPRGWIVGVAHLAFVPPHRVGEASGGDDASDAEFFTLRRAPSPGCAPGGAPPADPKGSAGQGREAPALVLRRGDEELRALAFDHLEELELGLARLREDATRYAPALLGPSFDRDAFEATCRSLALGAGSRQRLARALEDGHVIDEGGALRAGPAAFPAASRRT